LLGTAEATPGTTNAATPGPLDANGNTLYPALGLEGVKNLTPGEGLSSHKEINENGDSLLVVSYKSKVNDTNYVVEEAAEVLKSDVKMVGTRDFKYAMVNVYYGQPGSLLTMKAPTEAIANYAQGRIDLLKLKELSDIHINGIKVGTNGY